MKKIEDAAAFLFIFAVAILSAISVLGVWDFFSQDVITKSFETLGVLALVAVIIMVAGKFIESREQQAAGTVPALPDPAFTVIRRFTLILLITSVSLLAILGVLAIWEVIKDKDVLYKSMSSVGVLAFGTFIIVMTALEREGKDMMGKESKGISTGSIVLVLVLAYIIFAFIR